MDCGMPGFPSFTISQSLLRLTSIESVMPSNHVVLRPVPSKGHTLGANLRPSQRTGLGLAPRLMPEEPGVTSQGKPEFLQGPWSQQVGRGWQLAMKSFPCRPGKACYGGICAYPSSASVGPSPTPQEGEGRREGTPDPTHARVRARPPPVFPMLGLK